MFSPFQRGGEPKEGEATLTQGAITTLRALLLQLFMICPFWRILTAQMHGRGGSALCTGALGWIFSTQLRHQSCCDGQSHHLERLFLQSGEAWSNGHGPCARPRCGEQLDRQKKKKKGFSSMPFYGQVTLRVKALSVSKKLCFVLHPTPPAGTFLSSQHHQG